MSNIQTKKRTGINTDELLQAVVNLDNDSLQNLFNKVQDTIEMRSIFHKYEEVILLSSIKSAVPASVVRRYRELYKKFETEAISVKEMEEMGLITDFIEEKSAERLVLLNQLAKMKNMTLPELRKSIRISDLYA
jgi:hypothetical protein